MRMDSPRWLRLAISSVLGTTALISSVHAADQAVAMGVLEEITVTGTKREAAAQEVPITISAISAADLETAHVNDVRALASLAPGLVFSNPTGFNATGGGMRGTGVGVILVTQDAPVGFLVDDYVLSHVTSQFVNMFDTQQIEVYRGPQGTLFGASTTGGVISITSRKPELDKYYDDTSMTYGRYDNGANLGSLKSAVNLPLTDTLAARIAVMYDYDAGYYTDDKNTATFPNNVPLWQLYGIPAGTPVDPRQFSTNTVGNGERLGGKNVIAGKAKLLWKPTDNYSANFTLEFVKDTSGAPPSVNESGPTDLISLLGFPSIEAAGQKNPFSTGLSNSPAIQMAAGHRVDAHGLYLTQALQTSIGEFKSITGYREEQQRLPSTYTGEAFATLFDSSRNTNRYNFQQEFRFASKFDGPFNFVTGANYNHDRFDMLAYYQVGLVSLLPVADPTTTNANPFITSDGYVSLNASNLNDWQFQGTQQSRHQEGFFWDGNYNITDKVTFTAGVRASRDHKDFLRYVNGGGACTALTDPADIETGTPAGTCFDSHSNFISRAGISPTAFNDGAFSPLPLSAYGTVVNASKDWSKTTYRAVLDYKPVQGTMFYLSYATGFLAGGFSETCATISRCGYAPETNTNVEVGMKADLFDNKLRLNVSLYQTKYSDLQRSVVAQYTASDGTSQQETVTINAGSAKAQGVDLEAVWVPTKDLRIDAAVNYLDNKYTSGLLPDYINNPPGPSTDITQYKVPYSPKYKANLAVSYDIQRATGAVWTLHADGNYQSEAETDVYNTVYTQMQSRTLLNLSAMYRSKDGKWSITPYVANATNKIYRSSGEHVAGLWTFTNYGPPRSFGVTLNTRFE